MPAFGIGLISVEGLLKVKLMNSVGMVAGRRQAGYMNNSDVVCIGLDKFFQSRFTSSRRLDFICQCCYQRGVVFAVSLLFTRHDANALTITPSQSVNSKMRGKAAHLSSSGYL